MVEVEKVCHAKYAVRYHYMSNDFTEHEICRNVLFYYETLRTMEHHEDI